jgi:hypothetical protein
VYDAFRRDVMHRMRAPTQDLEAASRHLAVQALRLPARADDAVPPLLHAVGDDSGARQCNAGDANQTADCRRTPTPLSRWQLTERWHMNLVMKAIQTLNGAVHRGFRTPGARCAGFGEAVACDAARRRERRTHPGFQKPAHAGGSQVINAAVKKKLGEPYRFQKREVAIQNP